MARISLQRRGGFTLTELAIVMGVIGGILGGIWTAAAMVDQNMKVNKAQQEVEVIVSNVRALYSSRGSFPSSTWTDITASMLNANIFPNDMITTGSTLPRDPWGNNVAVFQSTNDPANVSNLVFEVSFASGVKSANCSPLLSRVVGNGGDTSLLGVWTGASWTAVTTTLDATSFATCTGAAFEYKLNG